jgi:hypothetical protein
VAGIFTQIRPVWIGEVESMPKTFKKLIGALYFYFHRRNFFSDVRNTAAVKKFFV